MLAKRSRRKEQVLSVEDCVKLIRWVEKNDPGLLVYPVLCLFAGLRLEREATGIDWADVDSKYRALAPAALGTTEIEASLDLIHEFSKLEDVSRFSELLR